MGFARKQWLIAIGLLGGACGRAPKPPAAPAIPPTGVFAVPRASEKIVVDGQCTEHSWTFAFRSPAFEDSLKHIAPHTELRATADDDNLYIEIYVADIDVESKDEIRLEVGPEHIVITPRGVTAPPGITGAVFCDDTIDNPKDSDEEWVSEVSIPWKMLGGHSALVRALRIDVGRGERPHALAWPPLAPALLKFDAEKK